MKFKLIAGPCVIEKRDTVFEIADKLTNILGKYDVDFIFKASFDKANRSSASSYRGVDIDDGLKILSDIKKEFNIKVLTDIHESYQADIVSEFVDIIQIPAFLCRQTDLLEASVKSIKNTKKCINIKKGQFMAPWDMKQTVLKMKKFGINLDSEQLWLTERGSSFGYNTLVVDYRSLPELKKNGCPVIFDATHSVQQPGGMGIKSGGQREFVAPLARAAVAVGVDGIFMETHPDPENALSDGPNMVPIHRIDKLVKQILQIKELVSEGFAPSSI